MYKVDIPLDTKESAAIQARKNKEAARKSRIFNARERTGKMTKKVKNLPKFQKISPFFHLSLS